MQTYHAKDLARSFRTVRKNTITIAQEIPEDKYSFRATPDTRTVAETLAHLAVSPNWQKRMHSEGITAPDFSKFGEEMQRMVAAEKALDTKAKIVAALQRDGDDFAAWTETLSDATLAEHVHFPAPVEPPSKSRLEMLLSVKEHEMHHRAQLMVIERMIGIVPHLTREFQARVAAAAGKP